MLLTSLLVGCADPEPLFERLPAGQTGVDFVNTITENDSLLNPFDLEYLYNGAGVGVGDFDGDGRPDLYFAGNTVDSKLYLNRGDFQFEDVTDMAGVAAPDAWATGVAVVDINQDGRSDLYVSVAGPGAVETRANRLFINQGSGEDGVPRFAEQADAYGLADTGYSTQAAFFDYDRDGDLDLYLLTNALEDADKNTPRPKRGDGRAPSTDRLYRNNGDGTFTDVSAEAGIQMEGYGLGVAVSDINKDGWPDVYAANDFIPNDLLYVNNGDGTFTNKAGEWLKHQSHNGMGVDVADFNNDTRPDIAVLDMLPPGNQRRKMMLSGFSASSLRRAMEYGYQPQYVRNTLQLHNGISPEGAPTFSEIGRLAGVAATDWSWAPLFADVDNDGWKDLFVSNGYGKDVTNQDYVEYGSQVRAFGTQEANRQEQLEALRDLPTVWLDNVIFQNDGDLTFTEKTRSWGLDMESLSTGAVLADLDQDGDLDLVTNNINDEAFIFANRLREQDTTVTYLRVQLDGPPGNRRGVGAKVVLHNDGQTQYRDHNPYRGYKSTLGPTVHFGLGTARQVDSLEVVWPDGRYQRIAGVEANQTITLHHAASGPSEDDGL
ncbi:MAG: RNA-binding protein, partial [Bacteroidetes bacterium]|nr:RNA-binding protein [Bacteroidota bacterium]